MGRGTGFGIDENFHQFEHEVSKETLLRCGKCVGDLTDLKWLCKNCHAANGGHGRGADLGCQQN
jgi:predicted HNH restriction endonuclease